MSKKLLAGAGTRLANDQKDRGISVIFITGLIKETLSDNN